MNRYTIKAHCTEAGVTQASFKTALDDLLLRAQPSLTYRLGAITQDESGCITAEIASDAKKDALESKLRTLESRLPIRVDALGWGWNAGTGQPPFQPAPLTFQVESRFTLVRYILVLSLPLAVAALAIARTFFHWKDGFELLLYAIYVIWLFSLSETPLDFRLYAQEVTCGEAGLVITYWFRRLPVSRTWGSIWGLVMRGRICVLSTDQGPVRFHVRSSLGPQDTDALIQAIAQRARLNNVDSGIGRVIYKRFDAP